jgi:hypothetical protein
MPIHSFVDEYKTCTYMLIAAMLRPGSVAAGRRVINSMVMPRQRRLHFHNERNSRRAFIIDRIAELPVEAVIYQARDPTDEKAARKACLTALIRDQLKRGAQRLVFEADESLVEFDRRLLNAEVRAHGAVDRVSYEQVRPFEEPLLAIPDAIAWCWARGGHWRVKVKQLVTDVHQV